MRWLLVLVLIVSTSLAHAQAAPSADEPLAPDGQRRIDLRALGAVPVNGTFGMVPMVGLGGGFSYAARDWAIAASADLGGGPRGHILALSASAHAYVDPTDQSFFYGGGISFLDLRISGESGDAVASPFIELGFAACRTCAASFVSSFRADVPFRKLRLEGDDGVHREGYVLPLSFRVGVSL